MSRMRRRFLILALALCAPPSVLAAEGSDNCTGYIDALPAAISTPGTWCVRQNHAVALASGTAIRVNADNVIIDCNRHEIDGTGAGTSTQTVGVAAYGRLNVTVRRCGLSGFLTGILLGGGGHAVEDNRISRSRYRGIYLTRPYDMLIPNLVRGNLVLDTGGAVTEAGATAIVVQGADILDNTVVGVTRTINQSSGGVGGISSTGRVLIERNRIRIQSSAPYSTGIVFERGSTVRDNHIEGVNRGLASNDSGPGNPPETFCTGNTILGATQPIYSCGFVYQNHTLP